MYLSSSTLTLLKNLKLFSSRTSEKIFSAQAVVDCSCVPNLTSLHTFGYYYRGIHIPLLLTNLQSLRQLQLLHLDVEKRNRHHFEQLSTFAQPHLTRLEIR